MGLIDAVIYSAPQGLTAFGNADGINTLVKTVKVSFIRSTRLMIDRDRDSIEQYSARAKLRTF
jgi:hypothetical protein